MARIIVILFFGLVAGTILLNHFAVPTGTTTHTLIYLAITQATTAVVTAAFCHYQLSQRKRISFGVGLTSWIISGLLSVAIILFSADGWHTLTPAYWTGDAGIKGGIGLLLVLMIFTVPMCILPALLVTICYQKKPRRETN